MDDTALTTLVRDAAQDVADRVPHLPRPARTDARALVWEAWQALTPHQPSHATLVMVARKLAAWRGVERLASVWEMRCQRPRPSFVRRTVVADRVRDWDVRLARKWQARLALSEVRLAWWQARVSGASLAPRPAIQPAEQQPRAPLELLHKRGRSRFS